MKTVRSWLAAVCVGGATLGFGCAQVPPCTVSPVEIEETREDVKVVQKDLAAAKDRAQKLSAELAAKKAELDSKKDKPAEMRAKLKDLKKGSGRDAGDDEDDKETA
jgi:septal ring factor EnvC (AmiA/AmiB activator)